MEPEKKVKNVVVETYAEDMARVIGDDKEGLVRKIIHSAEEEETMKKNMSPESKKNKLFMLLGIMLIVFALAAWFFFLVRNEVKTVEVEKQFIPIIFTDQISYIEVSGLSYEEIIQSITNKVNSTKVKKSGIEGIYLTENKQVVGLRRFLELVKSNLTPDANPLLVSDSFLMGAVQGETPLGGASQTGNFFILLSVRSLADIFENMRVWEAKMFSDLHDFFRIDINSETAYLIAKNFEDGIVENKNARILYNTERKPILMYVFIDDNSVLVTNSPDAIHEIILRLASARTKQ